jgi:hypothetical protein
MFFFLWGGMGLRKRAKKMAATAKMAEKVKSTKL